ncbi:MAG TPA: zinc-dependent alcohol dehydrogenase family protein [Parvularculaceae bacterium]|nr:zinc-dependent alcohol dehydrogenase family protein [Parvularculaceae bacterium]
MTIPAMRAMRLEAPRAPLLLRDLPIPSPGPGEILIRVSACAVCRTDLHVVAGELARPKLPLIPGHEIIGRVAARGVGADAFGIGARVGVPWLGFTCGACKYCREGRENLCAKALFTGYTRDGGFADYAVADERYAFPIPDVYDDVGAAPLMCAGLIGYRALRMAGDAKRLGLYGFGAAAHIVAQIAVHRGREVYAFTRRGDRKSQDFARALGASWAGSSEEPAPAKLDAAIVFAPVGALIPAALRAVDKAGVVVCAGIHMSDIPSFPYDILWEERVVRSVANLTRQDGEEFLKLAPLAKVTTTTHRYPLERANEALDDLRAGRFDGAAVLVMHG